jgi:hypothetical protein
MNFYMKLLHPQLFCKKYLLSIHCNPLCKPFEVEAWKLNLIIESLMIRDQFLEFVGFDSAQIQSMLNFLCCD